MGLKCGSASKRVNFSTIELLRGHSKLNNSQYTYISLTEEPKWLQNSSFITNFRNQPHFNKIAKLYSNKYTDHFCGSFPDIYYMPYGFCEIQTTLERSYKFSHAFNHLQKNEFLSSEMPHRTHIIFLWLGDWHLLLAPLFSLKTLKCAPLLPQCWATRILELSAWMTAIHKSTLEKGKRTKMFQDLRRVL